MESGSGTPEPGVQPSRTGPERVKRQRARKICTECRQQKLKCDAQVKMPNSCSRCLENGVECRVDPAFKRTRRRTSEPVASTSAPSPEPYVLPSNVAPLPPFAPVSPTSVNSVGSNVVPLPLPSKPTAGSELQDPILWISAFVIGGISISSVQATVLFSQFFERYHQFCPLFVSRRDPATLYLHEPFLFWTVIVIPLRHSASNPTFKELLSPIPYVNLAEEVKKLAAMFVIQPSRSVSTVQALLLLCEWPFPSVRVKEDLTWHFAGLATQTAMRIGLHRPEHSAEFSSREYVEPDGTAAQERLRAWIWCHVVSVNAAVDAGLPILITDDWVTLQASIPSAFFKPLFSQLPSFITQSLRTIRFNKKVSIALGMSTTSSSGQADSASTIALSRVLEAELQELEGSVVGLEAPQHLSANRVLRAMLLLARLRLHVFELQLDDTVIGPENTSKAEARARSLATCVKLLQLHQEVSLDEMWIWPRALQVGFRVASLCLIRLIATQTVDSVDVTTALALISSVYQTSLNFCVEEDDEPSRFVRLLAFAAREAQVRRAGNGATGLEQLMPVVRSRIGLSNWFYSTIGHAKAVRGSHEPRYPEDPAEPTPSNVAPVIDFDFPEFQDIQFNFSADEFNQILAAFNPGDPSESWLTGGGDVGSATIS